MVALALEMGIWKP